MCIRDRTMLLSIFSPAGRWTWSGPRTPRPAIRWHPSPRSEPRAGAGVAAVQKFVVVAMNSLLAAGLYATMSYGLAVIYGVMRIINLAHAGLMMLAAYATWALNDRFGLDPFLSMIIVAPAFFLLGMALYATLIRWLPRSAAGPSMQSLLLLFGVWLVVQNLAYAIWGGDTQSFLTPYTMESVPFLGGRLGAVSYTHLRA